MGAGGRTLVVINADTTDRGTHELPDAQGRARRRPDFTVIAERLDAEVVDWHSLGSAPRAVRLVHRLLGAYPALALLAWQRSRRAGAIWCDVENSALLLALLLKLSRRRVPLVCLGVYPAKAWKLLLWRGARLASHLDVVQPLTTSQGERLVALAGLAQDQVVPLPYQTDVGFWDPALATPRPAPRPYVFAAGLQHRDYPTLVAATEGLDVDLLVAAGSLWSGSGDSLAGTRLPAHVTVESMDYLTLRDAYAGASVVVAPTVEAEFAPGITSILEAMAMGRPVVATRAEGNGDYVVDRRRVLRSGQPRATVGSFAARDGSPEVQGQTGFYVAPADVAGLHRVLALLLSDRELAAEVAGRAQRVVREVHTVDVYAEHVAAAIELARERCARRRAQP